MYRIPIEIEATKYKPRKGVYPVAFKIFYSDKDWSVCMGKGNSQELLEAWEKAPNDYVNTVLVYENTLDALGRNTRYILEGGDFYSFDGKTFYKSFNDSRVCIGTVKNGKWAPDEVYLAIHRKAFNDFDIGTDVSK